MLRTYTIVTLTLALVILSTGMLMAQGEAGADCLIIPPSARANAMGQSYVALAEDATGIWWNPAGIAFVNQVAADLMHSQLVPDLASDVFYEYIGGAYKFGGIGTIGAAIVYLSYGEWEATDVSGEPIPGGPASSWEVAPTISGAIKIFDSIGIGMNLKFIYVSLAPARVTLEGQEGTGHSVAVDLGGLWRVPEFDLMGFYVSHLNFGLAVTNLGPSITFINRDQAAPLPRNLRVGFSYSPVYNELVKLTGAADVNRPLVEFERSNTYHIGGEFVYLNLLAVRLGYVHDRDGNIKDPTYGAGFILYKIISENISLRFDYANIPQARELDRVHRWSFGISF